VNLRDALIVLKVLTELFGCLYQICGLSVLLLDAETSQLLDPGDYKGLVGTRILTEHYHPLEGGYCESYVALCIIEASDLRAYAFDHLLTHLGLALDTLNAIDKLCALFVDFPEFLPRILTRISLLSNA
jgi:hypothetical protein